MSIKILLVDDHKIMRQGLRALVNEQRDFEVVGEAGDGRTAVRLIQELSPDVVVMDLRMPDLNGVEATRQAIAAKPDVKIVCLSAHADERSTADVLRAGASAYVLKENAFEELVSAIRTVVKNKVYLSPGVAEHVVGDYVRNHPAANGKSSFDNLSGREREVLQLLAEGRTTKFIAAMLHVSAKTAESHRRNLMTKLKIDNIAELTKYAVREGITPL